MTYNGLNHKVVLKGLKSPEGVSVDYLGRNIYWTDARAKTVNVGTIGGSFSKVLFHQDVNRPRAITVNPLQGKLYWADWQRKNPRIECSNMDGSDRRVLVDKTHLKTPNGLTLNHKKNELCWTDAGKKQIACVDLGGSGNIRILVTRLQYPFSLAFHGEHLFWTDWRKDQIQRMNLKKAKRGNGLATGISYDGQLYDIKSVQKCPTGCQEADFDYKGHEIKEIPKVASAEECNKHCKNTTTCQYYTYFTEKYVLRAFARSCFLKTSNAGRVYSKAGVISGGINCGIESSNPCSHNNGGCPYLCLMKGPKEKTCAKPDEINRTLPQIP
jgi:hypothetical protein